MSIDLLHRRIAVAFGAVLLSVAVVGLQVVRSNYQDGMAWLCSQVTWGAGGMAISSIAVDSAVAAPSAERLAEMQHALAGVLAVRWRSSDGDVQQGVGSAVPAMWTSQQRLSEPAPSGPTDLVLSRASFPIFRFDRPDGITMVASLIPMPGGGSIEILTDITGSHAELVAESRELGAILLVAGLAGLIPIGYATMAARAGPTQPLPLPAPTPPARDGSHLRKVDAGAIAHDLNNLLAVIDGSARLLERLAPDPEVARQYTQRITDAVVRGAALSAGLTQGRSLADQASAREVADFEPKTGRLVLLVEDDSDLRALYEQMLTHAGHDVLTAPDGLEALSLLPAGPYDVVVSDVCIPGMDGIALAHEIKKQAPRTAIVLMTGYAEADDGSVPDEVTVLAKPFSPEMLISTIGRVSA